MIADVQSNLLMCNDSVCAGEGGGHVLCPQDILWSTTTESSACKNKGFSMEVLWILITHIQCNVVYVGIC